MISSDSAKCTLAARLFLRKIEKVPGDFHHAGVFIHDHHAAGPHHCTGFCKRIKINGCIQKIFVKASAGRSTDLDGFEFFVVRNTAAYIKYEGSQRHPHGNFHQTWMNDISHNGKYCGSGTVLRTDASVPGRTMIQYGRNRRQGFDVIDHRRLVP